MYCILVHIIVDELAGYSADCLVPTKKNRLRCDVCRPSYGLGGLRRPLLHEASHESMLPEVCLCKERSCRNADEVAEAPPKVAKASSELRVEIASAIAASSLAR